MSRFTIPLCAVWLIASVSVPLKASVITYQISGTFGSQYGGPLNNGTFSGWFSLTTPLPITPNTGFSYILLTSFDVQLHKGSTTVELTPGRNGSAGLLSAAYETANGGDYLEFYDNSNDNLTLYFAAGFRGTGSVITHTSKGYVSDGGVGGFNNSQISNVTAGTSSVSTPEPGTACLFGVGALLALRRRKRPLVAQALVSAAPRFVSALLL